MPKILLIEDEKILAEMYKEKFEKAGFEVFVALDGDEGYEIVKKERPDLIILDILLPRVNGITFLKWLREDKGISKIPVIALSNYDDPKTKKEAFDLGIKEYLLKTDFTPEQLVQKIKSYF